MKVQDVNINELKPSEYNPRKADKKQCEDLKKSIKRFGLVDPLIVNGSEKRKNIIIGGHFRWRMAKDMGFKKVPVVYVDIKNIKKEKELNLRLNKNTGSWDWDLLANFDENILKQVGFGEMELGMLVNAQIDIDDTIQEKEKKETPEVRIVIDSTLKKIDKKTMALLEGIFSEDEINVEVS